MAASSRAVAAICASAAATVQAIVAAFSAGNGRPRRRQHHARKDERERQAEQEAHMRGADGAERGRQLLLHGVAQHLAAGGGDREDGP